MPAAARAIPRAANGGGQRRRRDVYIFRATVCNQIFESSAAQQRGADARHMHFASQGNHGHAHPQCLAGGGRAVIRTSIERDVDLVVEFEMLLPVRDPAAQLDTCRIDAGALAAVEQAIYRVRIVQR